MKKSILAILLSALMIADASAISVGRSGGFSSARSFSSSRSYSAPRPSYTAPAPRPPVVQKNVTVVNQSVSHSNGGGFFSSFFGAAAGAGITNALMAPKSPPPAPVIDCSLPGNKEVPTCHTPQSNK